MIRLLICNKNSGNFYDAPAVTVAVLWKLVLAIRGIIQQNLVVAMPMKTWFDCSTSYGRH